MSETLVRGLRVPGPHVPGWYPLVAERAHKTFHLGNGVERVEVLGSRMALDSSEYMQRRFYYHCYEAPAVRFFKRWLREGDVVLDVGAHVGFFTLLGARLVGAGGQVHAFEPVPSNYQHLQENVALNGYSNVRATRAAVGDSEGEVSLGLRDERLVGNSTCDYTVGAELGSVTAPVTTLDRYVAEHAIGPVRLVKIDVEGFEPAVLTGLARTFESAPPAAIMLELNAEMLFEHGSSPTSLLSMLTDHGYELHELGLTGHLKPAPTAAEIESAAAGWDYEHAPKSMLRVGLGTRKIMFNAVATHRTADLTSSGLLSRAAARRRRTP